ncbi:transporter substrate-binding domain-containing protein, partial [Klebsiella variicola]|uniref:transporter substrate-binding domain-containing protein n=2 Tax=Gammaproteobacteria TaxID=1236 RepID=UPI00273018B1
VRTDKADLLITLTPSQSRESQLRFTRPYLSMPYVLISRIGPNSPATLDEMAGKRLAVITGNPVRDQLLDDFPNITLVNAENAQQAMALVAN